MSSGETSAKKPRRPVLMPRMGTWRQPDAEDGHLAATHLGRRRQERTVAADGDGQVGIQRLDGEHAGKGYVDVQILPQKTAEDLLHTHFGSQLPQLIYNLPGVQILFHLIDVTKKGYAHRNGAF